MLTAKALTYTIGNRVILDDVSVNFCPGKLHLVLGANGAGKSTLIKILSNHDQFTRGEVLYGKKSLKDLSTGELARTRAVLSQNIDLGFPLPVKEVVMMGRYPHFKSSPGIKDINAVKEAMELFDIHCLSKRNYLSLSGGEKQRVQFARVIAQLWYQHDGECRYLFLDEPLSFLDIYYQYDFLHKIKSLPCQGNLVIVGVIHDLNLAAKFADEIVLLGNGKIIQAGDTRSVLNQHNIKKAYKMEARILDEGDEMRIIF